MNISNINKQVFSIDMKKIILFLIAVIFLAGCSTQVNDEVNISNNDSSSIENAQMILDEMNKNESHDEVLDIKKEEIMVLEKELEEKKKEFDKLVNESKEIEVKKVEKINETNVEIQKGYKEINPGISWQWQLSGQVDTSYKVDLYDVDLFDTPEIVIEKLKEKDIIVICYFSAGSWENWRKDANEFSKDVLGKPLDGWPDERWLDVDAYEKFSSIMEARMDLAVEKGCDGVEPDNVDGYSNNNGFEINYGDQIEYNKWLAEQAHSRNLSIALKNDLEQVSELEPFFDFAVNEQCFEYEECELLKPFVENNKAVLGVEYELDLDEFCADAEDMNFSWLKMSYDLGGERKSCDD